MPNEETTSGIRYAIKAATDKNTKYRLGTGAIAMLLLGALIADLVSLIPFAGDIVGPLFWILVSIFLYTKGFGFMNAGRLATELLSAVAEMIPVVQEFPLILAGMVVVIILSRVEDYTGMKMPSPGQGTAGIAQAALNQGGVRQPSPENNAPLNTGGTRLPQSKPE